MAHCSECEKKVGFFSGHKLHEDLLLCDECYKPYYAFKHKYMKHAGEETANPKNVKSIAWVAVLLKYASLTIEDLNSFVRTIPCHEWLSGGAISKKWFECPHCKKKLEWKPEMVGQTMACYNCKGMFKVSQ